jgi:hypothetical protein
VSTADSLGRAEGLLARLEEARGRLERTEDPEQALAIMEELAEIAKEVQAELERAKRESDAPA